MVRARLVVCHQSVKESAPPRTLTQALVHLFKACGADSEGSHPETLQSFNDQQPSFNESKSIERVNNLRHAAPLFVR